MAVNKDFHAGNLEELVSAVKQDPGKYSYASAGTGNPTHLGVELFKSAAGLDMVHVPYKGDNPAALATMAGHVPIMVGAYGSVAQLIQNKDLKAIASFGAKPLEDLENVPAIAEQGYPDVQAMIWLGLFAPKGLPAAIQQQLNTATKAVLEDASVRSRIEQTGTNVVYTTPQELHDYVASEYAKWGEVIKVNDIKTE